MHLMTRQIIIFQTLMILLNLRIRSYMLGILYAIYPTIDLCYCKTFVTKQFLVYTYDTYFNCSAVKFYTSQLSDTMNIILIIEQFLTRLCSNRTALHYF